MSKHSATLQAITTCYLHQTPTKPARIKATTASGISKTYSYDSLPSGDPHIEAAQNLARHMASLNKGDAWLGQWLSASLNPEGDQVHVPAYTIDWLI